MQPTRLLLLEDSDLDAELVLLHLRREFPGVEIARADSRETYIPLLDLLWDVVISDFRLPGFSAQSALLSLRERHPNVPLVVLSGAIGEETAVDLIKAGANDVVMKSNLTRLPPVLRRCMREVVIRRKEQAATELAEAALEERKRMLAVVSHDLKNPLASIQLSSQAAMKALLSSGGGGGARDTRLQEHLERIMRSSNRMLALIADVLDQAKIEAGRFRIERAWESVDSLLSDLVQVFQPLAQGKNVVLASNLGTRAFFGFIDYDRLFQALSNLVANAVKFTPEGGSVSLTLKPTDEKWIEFVVSDTGPGVPEADRTRIFEPYVQAESHQRQGTGLGLYIARGIVEAHGGRIHVQSSEEEGARFTVILPIGVRPAVQEDDAVKALSRASASGVTACRVLIVDDDEDLRDLFASVLSGNGFEVYSSADGTEGFRLMQSLQPSVVIVDYSMPGITGSEFVKRKQDLPPALRDIPVIMVSAEEDVSELAQELGLKYSLRKPPRLALLLQTVQDAIAKKG